jgi:hypothetical protein
LCPFTAGQLLLKIVVVLVLGKEPSEYDDEHEDEYNPLDLAPMIT